MVLVTSPGGMGCTYVIESLTGRVDVNEANDSDSLKHCSDPLDARFSGLAARVVYVWNDPLKAILSHERRGWMQSQCLKLGGRHDSATNLTSLWDACLAEETDVFGLLRHAENWLAPHRWPVFFLDMRQIARDKGRLGEFIGLGLDNLCLLPRSSYEQVRIPDRIREMYHEIDSRVRALGEARNQLLLSGADPALAGNDHVRIHKMKAEKLSEDGSPQGSGGSGSLRVVLASDAAGIDSCATVLASLLRHTTGPVEARIFSRDVEPVELVSGRLMLEVMRVPEGFQVPSWASIPADGGCDWAAALACCGDWDRALVLGNDQLVVGDAARLYGMDLGGGWVGARMEAGGGHDRFGLPLVLDLAAMREADVYGQVVESLWSGAMTACSAFRSACGDRVANIGQAVAEFPSARGMVPEVVVARFAGLFKSGSGGISGTALWRAHETDWPELTCGLWCPGVGKDKNGDMPQERLVELVRGTRAAGSGCQVLEIGGWDFSGMAAAASRWLYAERDRWTVIFRTHRDGLALEEAITRFGACLGACAPATEILDGTATEILAWLMTQEDRWEKVDAVILHPPGRAGDFLTEACMAWSLLRPGGAMVIQAGREQPPQDGVCPFARALDGFVAAVSGGALDRDGTGWCVVRKGGTGWFAHGTTSAEGGTDQPAGGPWEGPAWQRLPDTRVDVAHPYWRDEVMLHHGGLFTRKTTGCGGRWIWNPVLRELTLAWKVHHPETFVVGADGTATPAPPPPVPLVCHTPEKVVFVRPNGRTGNHLFQYAYGLHLARKFGCRLHGNLYLLAGMEGVPPEVTHGTPPLRTAMLRDVDDTMAARCLAGLGIDGLELDGFFQDYGHFEDIREELLPILGAVEKRDAIGVHVRRGDYVGSGFEMGLTPAYFVSGVRQILEDYPAGYREILIFSDDPAWCAENLLPELTPILPTTVFDGGVNETLRAMKSTVAMVIPNSTFSWWGAWLADAPVVFPSAWIIANGAYQAGLGCTRRNWQVNRRFLGEGDAGEPTAIEHPKVLFLVKSAAGNHERRAAQEERWLKDLPAGAMYFFCIGGYEGAVPRVEGHHLLLPCPDDYGHLPAKMKRMVAWVAWESEWTWFDYVVILDDDVVADIGRLYDFLRLDPDHFGHRLNGDPAHILGMCTGYSMKAFRILAGVVRDLPDDGIDDLLVGRAVWEPFAGLNVMTDGERIKAFGAEATEATFAMEIRPFSAAAMRDFRFPPPPVRRRVSFSLFGNDPLYWRGAIANADLVRMHYPGWEAVFHTKDVPPGALAELKKRGATVVECDHANMMFARFLPFCEEGVVISRDCDSRIHPREVRAVNEWLASDKPYHVIRDHPEHVIEWAPVMGGLWGGRRPLDECARLSLERAMNDPGYAGWGGDQRWLAEVVWGSGQFMIHQYDQAIWMKDGWNPGHFCGMRHEISAGPGDAREVVLWEGFFNRLNGLINGLLIHGSSFRVRWAVNTHLPHRFEELFDPIPGIEVVNDPDLTYWPQNTNPAKGPLCHWFVSRNCNADLEEIAGAYRHLISRLKVGRTASPCNLAIHFRGLHHAANESPGDFARWCLEQAKSRGAGKCFAIADSGREEIAAVLEQGGIQIVWGRSVPLAQDLDRNGLDEVKDFIGDALTLADCDTVLTSFDETTIVDPARAFGREVIAFSGTRVWSECWFHHHARQTGRAVICCTETGEAEEAGKSCALSRVDDEFTRVLARLEWQRDNDRAQYPYGTHIEALKDILDALFPLSGKVLLEVGGGYFSTALLLATGASVFTVEQGQNVPEEENRAWLRNLRELYRSRTNWHLMDLPGTTAWRHAHYPPGVLFCFVDGNGNCRKEIVEFMLQRGVPVVAAHDSETASYRYAQINPQAGYSVHDFRGREVWTRIWSKHQEVTRVLDENPLYHPVGDSPPVIDLRAIPACLIGADPGQPQEQQHRYWNRPEYAVNLFPHTCGVPAMPGGHAFGCSAAHLAAAKLAIASHSGCPVLLLESDAVQTVWFQPVLEQIPPDADIIWLGCSNGIYDARPSPEFIPNPNSIYQRLRGVCQASHAILLVTDSGKRAWRTCCEQAVAGEMGASTDLVCSIVGVTLCRQYVLTKPAFFQPDYYATLIPLVPEPLRP